MIFGWIKRLLQKKEYSNEKVSDLASIDTSFIHIPKLSDLSKDEQLKVEKYIEELKKIQIEHPHELVLKYGNNLLDKSNSEIEFFMVNLDEIIKNISSVIDNTTEINYFKLLLSKEEIKQSVDEFYEIMNEAKLRLIALDTYIKKEDRRKYDFLGIFGKAERIRYLTDRNKLLNEKDLLKTTMKISSEHLLATYKALKEEEMLLNKMENYINSSKSFNTIYCDDEICQSYVEILHRKKLIAEILFPKNIIIDDNNCDELEYLCNVCKYIYNIDHGFCERDVSTSEKNELLSHLEYKKLIPFLVKENRVIKKCAYDGRYYYKTLIFKINELIEKYQTSPSYEWNIERLELTVRNYLKIVSRYIIICNDYISDDAVKELRESLFHLNYYFNISRVRRYNKSGDMSSLGKSLILGEYTSPIIHDELLKNIKWWNWDYKDEMIYYDNISKEMLKTIGILNLPIKEYKNLEKRINEVINDLKKEQELPYLFDIYNSDCFTFKLNKPYDHFKRVRRDNLSSYFNIELYLTKLNQKYLNNSFCHIRYDENLSVEDVFYLDKFLNSNDWIIEEIFNNNYGFVDGMNSDIYKIFIYKILKKLDLQYDERIIVIPKQIEFKQMKESKLLNKAMNDLNIKERNLAIYIASKNQINVVYHLLKENNSHIKYLFMSEYLYSLFNKYKNGLNQKIIIVPNNIQYAELSSYLNQELEKEKSMVLSKRINY